MGTGPGGIVIRGSQLLLRALRPAEIDDQWRAMVSSDLQLQVCYCSIFDECWQSDLTKLSLKPAPVKACVQPKIPFDQGLLNRRP